VIHARVPAAFLLLAAFACTAAASDTTPGGTGSGPAVESVERLTESVRGVLPPSWRIVETDTARVPIGWDGEAAGLYVEVEDTRTRFLHPNGFHYYSFYRVWLMPPSWEGEMAKRPYVSDSAPAFLLGASDDWIALYHTAGGNVWHDGLVSLCAALGLNRLDYPSTTERIVDMAMEERLGLGATGAGAAAPNSRRILGLKGEGPNLYLEYVFPQPKEDEPRVELSDLTAQLAATVFGSMPEIESLYLRRCTADSFTDTIVQRD
jgi:hypothetical protein